VAVRDQFSDDELAAIRRATQAAEAQTGGELVCVIIEQCDTYQAALWQMTALGALAGTLAAGLWHSFLGLWGTYSILLILLPPLLGGTVGLLLVTTLSTLRRALISPAVLDRRVDRRAAVAFLDEGIFDTRDRTGVLLFIALFEHRIRILRDRGVEDRVPPAAWDEIAEDLSLGLRRGRKGASVVAAVEACGDLLVRHGVERRPDDTNELTDEPRLLDE
jgi:putative membrane protein